MADQNHGAGLAVDGGLRRLDVFAEGGLRLLHDRYCVPVLLEDVGDRFPAGAIGKRTMHQDHVLDSTPPVAGNYALTRVHVSSHTYDGLGLPCVECRGETPAGPWSFRITRMQPVETMGCS